MFKLDEFYRSDGDQVIFTRDQGSRFAKTIADDFNPLHDPAAKLFCVPGDLLFAVALARLGLSQRMCFTFAGMVDGEVALTFQQPDQPCVQVTDVEGKTYLKVEREGAINHDPGLIARLTSTYVEFSGRTFPHILNPLLAEHGVMLNPARPLVIYESMRIRLERLDLTDPRLDYTGASLEYNGKKGNVSLDFLLTENGKQVGDGSKYMLVRGLRDYDQATVERVAADYLRIKREFAG